MEPAAIAAKRVANAIAVEGNDDAVGSDLGERRVLDRPQRSEADRPYPTSAGLSVDRNGVLRFAADRSLSLQQPDDRETVHVLLLAGDPHSGPYRGLIVGLSALSDCQKHDWTRFGAAKTRQHVVCTWSDAGRRA